MPACRLCEGHLLCKVSNPRYHRYREIQYSILLDVIFLQSEWSVKCRSRVPGHGAWLKSVSQMITKVL